MQNTHADETGRAGQPLKPDAITLRIAPMALVDIPSVMEIERASFPLPWPEQAYRYELLQNPNAYFIVAQALPTTRQMPLPVQPARSRRRTLLRQLFQRSHVTSPGASDAATPGAYVVVGYAGMWMLVDEAHISTIASHPAWRGRGIGELLLLSLIREAERRNAIFVTLEVRVSNTVAQRLYRKYQFEETGLRKRYYRDNGEDAIIMTVQHFQRPEYKRHLDALEQALRRRLAALSTHD
ncbi:MAG: ribosomal protein S18-alanine N-acetyltransferase [Anaerolineae bacterium]|nr:ribosomal protein S18-alanine N-acetyltransferase [Thermoflexales bacterium]MDW8406357.1 ribosomal protein S18-alanine N-acetyltransferase [Anaerolineae bacterium]